MNVKGEYTTVLLMTSALTPRDRTAVQVKQVTPSEMNTLTQVELLDNLVGPLEMPTINCHGEFALSLSKPTKKLSKLY